MIIVMFGNAKIGIILGVSQMFGQKKGQQPKPLTLL